MPFEVMVGLHVTDRDAYQEYRRGMLPILESYGGGFRYDFVVSEVLKADVSHPINRVFAIFFPDRVTHDRFYADPAYLGVRNNYHSRSVAARVVIAEYER